MSHTPGPWRIDVNEGANGNDSEVTYEILAGNKVVVAVALDRDYSYPEGGIALLDDALLIAAAPDLLEALKAAKDALRSYRYGNSSPELAEEIVRHAVAAIAKAEGTSVSNRTDPNP